MCVLTFVSFMQILCALVRLQLACVPLHASCVQISCALVVAHLDSVCTLLSCLRVDRSAVAEGAAAAAAAASASSSAAAASASFSAGHAAGGLFADDEREKGACADVEVDAPSLRALSTVICGSCCPFLSLVFAHTVGPYW